MIPFETHLVIDGYCPVCSGAYGREVLVFGDEAVNDFSYCTCHLHENKQVAQKQREEHNPDYVEKDIYDEMAKNRHAF